MVAHLRFGWTKCEHSEMTPRGGGGGVGHPGTEGGRTHGRRGLRMSACEVRSMGGGGGGGGGVKNSLTIHEIYSRLYGFPSLLSLTG